MADPKWRTLKDIWCHLSVLWGHDWHMLITKVTSLDPSANRKCSWSLHGAEHDPGRANNSKSCWVQRSEYPPKGRPDPRTWRYQLSQEAFLGVAALKFGQLCRQWKETALSRLLTADFKKTAHGFLAREITNLKIATLINVDRNHRWFRRETKTDRITKELRKCLSPIETLEILFSFTTRDIWKFSTSFPGSFPFFSNDLGRSVTPTFLSRNFSSELLFFPETDFIYNYLHIVQKWTKISMWEVKKNSRFLSTGHRILPSCGCKARESMVAKCELVL